ncbi:hypothetical protein [Sphingomonas fennica]|jgi:hypothetical protein|nr:hypothetical protein [Sphingomonas fennica]
MTAEPNQTDQLLQGLGFKSEHWIEAHKLVATHGRRAQQHVVDLMQAALRADDEETARGYDTLLKLMQMRDRFLREKQVATKAAGRLTVAPVGLAPPDTSTSG